MTWRGGAADGESIRPEIVLGFHSLCLVKPINDDDWSMGSIIRRYQGFGGEAVADAKLRMPLYAILEKYNRIVREA